MITIRIIKLPPEAKALAKQIEDTLSAMIAKVVKSKVSVDNDIKNLEVTMYESILEHLSTS